MTKLEEELRAVELAFAKTMADRDHAAFTSFLSDEVVFVGADGALRGKIAVSEGWAHYFEADEAPFSWEPDLVVVVESGELGMTSGPVRDADGVRIGGFQSCWRRESGTWRIVLDHACE
ncbi:MAG TPA: nuclear transport factor 2 family protein [bacterium]|nr:nuclear transport factor 2 family protein [bacterium]